MKVLNVPKNTWRRYTTFNFTPNGTDVRNLPRSAQIRKIACELVVNYTNAVAPLADTPLSLIQEIKIVGDGQVLRRIDPSHCYWMNQVAQRSLPPRTPVVIAPAGQADALFYIDFMPGDIYDPAESRLLATDYDTLEAQVIWRDAPAIDPVAGITSAFLIMNTISKVESLDRIMNLNSLIGDAWKDDAGLSAGNNTLQLMTGYQYRRIMLRVYDVNGQPVDVADLSSISLIKDGQPQHMNLSSYFLRGDNAFSQHIDAIDWPIGYLMFEFTGGEGKLSDICDTRATEDFVLEFVLANGTTITRARTYYDIATPAGTRSVNPDQAAVKRMDKIARAVGLAPAQIPSLIVSQSPTGSPDQVFRAEISIPGSARIPARASGNAPGGAA